jgi:hypothetical protein
MTLCSRSHYSEKAANLCIPLSPKQCSELVPLLGQALAETLRLP